MSDEPVLEPKTEGEPSKKFTFVPRGLPVPSQPIRLAPGVPVVAPTPPPAPAPEAPTPPPPSENEG